LTRVVTLMWRQETKLKTAGCHTPLQVTSRDRRLANLFALSLIRAIQH